MSKKTYTVFFYNTGYVKHGFESVAEALEYIINGCFEGCVQNNLDEVVVSWSPIGGTRWHIEDAA